MISGASEQELELANARADIVMKLDNTSTYESWLIIDTYLEQLEKENQELKEKYLNAVSDYETTMSEKNELKKQLEEEEQWRIKIAKENDEAFRGRMILIEEKEKLKEQLEEYKDKINWYENFEVNKTIDKLRLKHNTQQKEFIKWLEDEIKHLEHSRYVSFNEFGKYKFWSSFKKRK